MRQPHALRYVLPLLLATSAHAQVRVVTTTSTLAAIAREVGGDRVAVEAIARPTEDPHFVSPKPSFMVRLRRADLFVAVGMDLEVGWAPPLLQGSRNRRIQPGAPGHVDSSLGIHPLEVPAVATRAEGDVHPRGNPHYWLDPANGAVIARNVAAGLERVDPEGASVYRANLDRFEARLAAALRSWRERLRAHEGAELVSHHRTWPYLERAFGVRFAVELEPKPGIPPSPRHLAEVTELMRARRIRVVVHGPYSSPRFARTLAERVGGVAVALPVEVGGREGIDDYFALFDTIVEALDGALRSVGAERP